MVGRDSEFAPVRGRPERLSRARESSSREPDAAGRTVPGFDTEAAWRNYSSIRQETGPQDLGHVARIAMLGEMTAGLAHDLSQPVAAIQNFASACQQCLTADPLDQNALASHLEHIRQQAEQAGRILDRVRSFARNSKPQREPHPINHLVREALTLLECDARFQGVTVQCDLDPEDPIVEVDAVSIEQVIVNLLRNACEAMAESSSETRRIAVRTRLLPTRETEVSVSDTGPGMSSEVMRNAFIPFFTTKEQGLGMGLAISRSIIDFHRGTLAGERNPEGGMTFRFILPAS